MTDVTGLSRLDESSAIQRAGHGVARTPVLVLSSRRSVKPAGGMAPKFIADQEFYNSARALLAGLSPGALAVVCAEELLTESVLPDLAVWVLNQPVWSDLPFVVLINQLAPERRRRLVEALGNVVFVDAADETALQAALQSARYSRLRKNIVRDTLDRQATDLAHSGNSIRAVFETSHQYQGLLSIDGSIVYANATALHGVEALLEDVKGHPFWNSPWFSQTPGMPETVRAAIAEVAGGREVAMRMALKLPIGERTFDFSMRPVFDDHGKVVAIVPEAVDITGRLQTEEGLRQAQKMEAVGQLTGGGAPTTSTTF